MVIFWGVREQLSGGKKSYICQLRCDGDFRCLVLYSETWRLEVSICTISKPASCIIEIFRFRCGHSGIKRMLRWRRRRPMLFFFIWLFMFSDRCSGSPCRGRHTRADAGKSIVRHSVVGLHADREAKWIVRAVVTFVNRSRAYRQMKETPDSTICKDYHVG